MEIIIVYCVEVGLRIVCDDYFDVILFDICFFDGDGIEFCEWLVDDLEMVDIFVIIVSGCECVDVICEVCCVGCCYYFCKFYDLNVLFFFFLEVLWNDFLWSMYVNSLFKN